MSVGKYEEQIRLNERAEHVADHCKAYAPDGTPCDNPRNEDGLCTHHQQEHAAEHARKTAADAARLVQVAAAAQRQEKLNNEARIKYEAASELLNQQYEAFAEFKENNASLGIKVI